MRFLRYLFWIGEWGILLSTHHYQVMDSWGKGALNLYLDIDHKWLAVNVHLKWSQWSSGIPKCFSCVSNRKCYGSFELSKSASGDWLLCMSKSPVLPYRKQKSTSLKGNESTGELKWCYFYRHKMTFILAYIEIIYINTKMTINARWKNLKHSFM